VVVDELGAEPARLAPGAPSAAAPKNRGSRTTPANPNLTRTGKRTAEVDAMADADVAADAAEDEDRLHKRHNTTI
jgi:hypothetical protein